SVATLAAFGNADQPPPASRWAELLNGPLSAKEHPPSPRGSSGRLVYSRVSGVQVGSLWRATITDPGKPYLAANRAPISWPIAALERGSLGTGQVQTAELKAAYPGTAWAAHGNYGVEYDLTIPLRNTSNAPLRLQVQLDAPLKHDQALGGLRFNSTPAKAVVFRGSVEVSGLDGDGDRASGRRFFHLVQRAGQQGPALGSVSLPPGGERRLQLRLIYPADATPPQALSLLPISAATADAPVKQSPPSPASSTP
ncbi:MAG: DUF3370 family protein, partial [Cyanobium sp.]